MLSPEEFRERVRAVAVQFIENDDALDAEDKEENLDEIREATSIMEIMNGWDDVPEMVMSILCEAATGEKWELAPSRRPSSTY